MKLAPDFQSNSLKLLWAKHFGINLVWKSRETAGFHIPKQRNQNICTRQGILAAIFTALGEIAIISIFPGLKGVVLKKSKILPIDFNHPLVAANKLRAIFRFINWQLKSRLFPQDFIHWWVAGSKFYVKKGETGLTQNIYAGLHEFSDMCFLLHLLRKEDHFIDVGANSGSYSILAGAVMGARVLAVEPIPSAYERLVSNFKLNGIESPSKAMNVGLGSMPGSLFMTNHLDCTNQIIFSQDTFTSIKVDIETLDIVTSDLIPTLIKIDVEGWELEVIRGGLETLQNPKLMAIILELNESGLRYGFSDDQILESLSEFGFQPYSYDPFERILILLQGKNLLSGNTIFIRDVKEVTRRIRTAPRFEILGNLI